MTRTMVDVILKRFEAPDETRVLVKGRFEVVTLGGVTIGRATYEPGWRWSLHVGPTVGADRCTVEHVGLVVSGHATVSFADGKVHDIQGRRGRPERLDDLDLPGPPRRIKHPLVHRD